MLRVFLASHAHLASGMRSSYSLLAGAAQNLTTYDAYVEGDGSTLAETLDAYFENEVCPDDEVLLLSDIYGGSVNTQMCSYLDRARTRLVSGVNLAFLIEVLSLGDSALSDERLNKIIEESRQTLMRVRLDVPSEAPVSEDDFF